MAKLIFQTKNQRASVTQEVMDGREVFMIEVMVPEGKTYRLDRRPCYDQTLAVQRAEALAG